METIRYKNMLKIFKWSITVALYMEIIATIVVIISLIFILAGEGELISSYDIKLLDQQAIAYDVTSKNASLNDLELLMDKGSIMFSSNNIGYYILKIMDAIFILAVSIFITVLLKRIVKSMQDQHPFTIKNMHRIRNIAFLLMSLSAFSLIQSIMYRSYILRNVSIEGYEYADLFSFQSDQSIDKIWVGLNMNIQALIIGFILLIIAEVFRIGVIMKLDNESIV
jgi:hypothetical protein